MMEINPCPFMITLKDGKNVTMFKGEDFLEVVDQYMGGEASRWLREHLEALEKEADYTTQKVDTDLKSYEASLESNARAFQDIQDWVISLKNLLEEKRIDRRKINRIADLIMQILENQI